MSARRIGFTGHQGLTRDTEAAVAEAINTSLAGFDAPTGICSLAEGSDQIFANALLATGGDLIVILPCDGYQETFTDPSALNAFQRLLNEACEVISLKHDTPSEEAFWDAGRRVVLEADRVFAVWDGKPAGGLGGTADVVRFARAQGKEVEIIWPENAARA